MMIRSVERVPRTKREEMKYRSHIIDTNKHWKRSKKPPKKRKIASKRIFIYTYICRRVSSNSELQKRWRERIDRRSLWPEFAEGIKDVKKKKKKKKRERQKRTTIDSEFLFVIVSILFFFLVLYYIYILYTRIRTYTYIRFITVKCTARRKESRGLNRDVKI